jgi:tetratricopeptide (TPR) repeat protein
MVETYYNRGVTKYLLTDYQGALSDFNKAIEKDPNAETYLRRGIVKYILMDYQGATGDFNKAIELNPQLANAFVYRGSVKFIQKDFRTLY